MKITFNKLITKSPNVYVKYDEEGNNVVTYPVSEIRQNNNKIEFDSTICADLDNIEISTDYSTGTKPSFTEDNSYDTLFEFLNGCKTAKWVIDQEHFPYTYKKLFSPRKVYRLYKFYTDINDIEDTSNIDYMSFYLINDYIGYYDISEAQAVIDSFPLAYDGNIYIYNDETQEYHIYNSEIDENPNMFYILRKYSMSEGYYHYNTIVLNSFEIDGHSYTVISHYDDYYLINSNDVDKIATGNYIHTIILQFENVNNAYFYLKPQNYYFEESSSGDYQHYDSYYLYSPTDEDEYYYTPGNGNYSLVETNNYEEGYYEIADANVYNELVDFFTNPNNEFSQNNCRQPAYRVYIDGYDLMDDENLELSKKLFLMLSAIQYGWPYNVSWFPLISYSSFNEKTLQDFDNYNNCYTLLFNCNSLVSLLGRRYICNWSPNDYNSREMIYLSNLNSIQDDYLDNTYYFGIYERNINDNDSIFNSGYINYYIMPSNKSLPIKNLYPTNTSYEIYMYFLEGGNTPKNYYIFQNIYDHHVHSDDDTKEFFQGALREDR